jgi:hypothetical protein
MQCFNRQVGLWLGYVTRMLFHNDPAKNAAVKNLVKSEVAAAQPMFSTPNVDPAGLIDV